MSRRSVPLDEGVLDRLTVAFTQAIEWGQDIWFCSMDPVFKCRSLRDQEAWVKATGPAKIYAGQPLSFRIRYHDKKQNARASVGQVKGSICLTLNLFKGEIFSERRLKGTLVHELTHYFDQHLYYGVDRDDTEDDATTDRNEKELYTYYNSNCECRAYLTELIYDCKLMSYGINDLDKSDWPYLKSQLSWKNQKSFLKNLYQELSPL